MKQTLIFITLLLPILYGCGTESRIEKEILHDLKLRAYDPSSVEIISLEIFKDTLPIYLDPNYSEEIEEFGKLAKAVYSDNLFEKASKKEKKRYAELVRILKAKKTSTPIVYNIALVECSLNNMIGVRQSSKIIYVFSEQHERMMALFACKNLIPTLNALYKDVYNRDFPRNSFGYIELARMPRIDGFVLKAEM